MGWRRLIVLPALSWIVLIPIGRAEATCGESRIEVASLPTVIGTAIPATWAIWPVCDVIESGVLLGTDSVDLRSLGQPVYGARDPYQQSIEIDHGGVYWMAAYAVDEDGLVIRSPVRPVIVAVPPPSFGPHGSHGAPSSYTGTDADFLQQAGDPHFASLSRFTFSHFQVMTERPFGPFAPVTGGNSRVTASTHTDQASIGQNEALTLGDTTFTPTSADLAPAIDSLTTGFAAAGYPRSGLYIVDCGVSVTQGVPSSPGCAPDARAYLPGGVLPGTYREEFSTQITFSSEFTTTISDRASAAYFIPRQTPDKQLTSARLRALAIVLGNPSLIAVNGKLPSTIEPPIFSNCPYYCTTWLTWDFTAEAAAIAAQGGGELALTFDPIPPAFDLSESSPGLIFQSRDALYLLPLRVNYPWSHGGVDGALTLTFQRTCPKSLVVNVSPSTVRPRIPPGNITPADVASMPTTATVDVHVSTCPPQSGGSVSVEISLEVQAPKPATSEAAGHLHDTRPPTAKGNLSLDGRELTRCIAQIDERGVGSCGALLYEASEVSGVETIIARAQDFTDAEAKVTVKVPLTNLADVRTNFFRLTGLRPGLHTDNHWGTPTTIGNIQVVALDFFAAFGATLGINDLSLPLGGLFDINGGWSRPHDLHRTGVSVDIDRRACLDPTLAGTCNTMISVPRRTIQALCGGNRKGRLALEETLHCEFPG